MHVSMWSHAKLSLLFVLVAPVISVESDRRLTISNDRIEQVALRLVHPWDMTSDVEQQDARLSQANCSTHRCLLSSD